MAISLVTNCYNNTILNNTANNNDNLGIYLYGGCMDNNITGNEVLNNDADGSLYFNIVDIRFTETYIKSSRRFTGCS